MSTLFHVLKGDLRDLPTNDEPKQIFVPHEFWHVVESEDAARELIGDGHAIVIPVAASPTGRGALFAAAVTT